MQDVIKKFRFKDNGIVINSPKTLENQFVKLGFHTSFDNRIKATNTLVFVKSKEEILDFFSTQLKNIEEDSILWIAFPKGTSKIKTDINRDTIRDTGENFGITTVAAISINATWSALRFRPMEKVGMTKDKTKDR